MVSVKFLEITHFYTNINEPVHTEIHSKLKATLLLVLLQI